MVKLLFTAWIAFWLGSLVTVLGIAHYDRKLEREEEEERDEEREMVQMAMENALKKEYGDRIKKEELNNERETKRLSK